MDQIPLYPSIFCFMKRHTARVILICVLTLRNLTLLSLISQFLSLRLITALVPHANINLLLNPAICFWLAD